MTLVGVDGVEQFLDVLFIVDVYVAERNALNH